MKVGYIGAFKHPTGYGEATRSHVKAIQIAGSEVFAKLNHANFGGMENELMHDEEIDAMLERGKGEPPADFWVWHVTPDDTGLITGKPNFLYSVWETHGLPYGWADRCNQMDGLLTCSDFSAGLFREGGVTKPIVVAPHPIDVDFFKPAEGESPIRQIFPGVDTLFLVVAQWMPRKGIEDILAAYGAEFEPDEKVGLVLLVWRWGHSVNERRACKGYSKEILGRLNKSVAKVWHLGDKVSPVVLAQLYQAADVLVSASRGEAFSLPIFEAAASGTPSISTGWGGMWDFLTDDMGYRVAYDIETVNNVGAKWKHYNAHQKWARVRLDDLRRAMREAHENPEQRKQKGLLASQMVRERLNPATTGKQMVEALQTLLDTKTQT